MLPTTVTRAAGAVSHFLFKNAPTLWTMAGTGAMIGSTALAIRAALDYKADVAEPLLTMKADIEVSNAPEEQKEQARQKVRNTLIIATARRFALPIGLGIVGIAAISIGNGVALGRIAALSSALAAETARADGLLEKIKTGLPEALKGVSKKDLQEKATVDAIVNESIKKATAKTLGDETDANIWFDNENPSWDASELISQTFITAQTTYLNQKLFSRGYLSLNEVYKAFSMPETRSGAVLGWDLKQDADVIIDLHEVKEYVGIGDERVAVWGFNIQAPHNLIA